MVLVLWVSGVRGEKIAFLCYCLACKKMVFLINLLKVFQLLFDATHSSLKISRILRLALKLTLCYKASASLACPQVMGANIEIKGRI